MLITSKSLQWGVVALLFLSDTPLVAATTIFPLHGFQTRNHLDDVLGQAGVSREPKLEHRSPQNQQPPPEATGTAAGSSSGQLELGSAPAELNTTTANACQQQLKGLTTVTNPTGFAGCYNILSFDPVTSQFQSDLRIYSKAQPSGKFAGLERNEILVLLNFPSTTSFKSLQKRMAAVIIERQDDGNETAFQQFSLAGVITTPMDMKKLDELQTASLLTPQIAMQATIAGNTYTANMTADDLALFATGQFTDLATRANEVIDPSTASGAIAIAKGFVLPGTRLGIFPVGLIVTSVWAVIFLVVYGAGTIARLRYRDIYRKRTAAMARIPYNMPGIGKL